MGQLTPGDQRDIPYRMTSCTAIKAGGRNKNEGHSEDWHFSSQVTITCDGALPSWRRLNTCLPMNERIPYFDLLA